MTAPQIDFNFYEQPSTISYFDAILSDLQQDLTLIGADATITAPELAYFTARFLQFQTSQQQTVHLPIRFFQVQQDVTKPSPLYTILKSAYIFQSDKDLDGWQFDAPEEKNVYLELIQHVRQALQQDGFYIPPVVAFDEQVPNNKREEWTRMIHSMGGKFFSSLGFVSEKKKKKKKTQ
jgi:hypothetical protein